jgi:conjugal transfer pilus assembly protein TraF
MFIVNTIALILISCFFTPVVFATDTQFLKGKEDGWWWYIDPPSPPKPLPPTEAKPAPKPDEKPTESKKEEPKKNAFSVVWLRENLEKLRVIAIDNPSKENVTAYLYAQRMMMDKSSNFADIAARIGKTDPLLDEASRVPISTAMRMGYSRGEVVNRKALLKSLADKGGLWFFFDSRCSFCVLQSDILARMGQQHGFIVKNISLDGKKLPEMTDFVVDQGQFKSLGLKITPTVVLAVPPKDVLVVSQGGMSMPEIEERILLAAEDRGMLSKDEIKLLHPGMRGVVPSNEMTAPDGVDMNDPKSWIEHVKKTIDKQQNN